MADGADHKEHVHGEMDISMQQGTYDGFMTLTKWSTVAIVVLLAIMGAALL